MSKTPPPQPINRNKKNTSHLGIAQKFLLLVLIVIALMRVLPIVVVLFIGLLPTLTLMIVDGKNINKLVIVGCFNLAGVFVYVFNIMKNYSVDNALFVFSDIFNIILMLGSAAIGLLVYYEIPMLFVYISRATNQRHILSIDARIEKLKEIWGPEVIGK